MNPRVVQLAVLLALLTVTLLLTQAGCAAATHESETENAVEPTECVVVEVQNQGHAGVSVSIEWENMAARRLGRVGVSERRVFTLPFQNNMLNLRMQAEGSSVVAVTNSQLAVPGARFSVVFYVNQAGPFRRVGTTQCP